MVLVGVVGGAQGPHRRTELALEATGGRGGCGGGGVGVLLLMLLMLLLMLMVLGVGLLQGEVVVLLVLQGGEG